MPRRCVCRTVNWPHLVMLVALVPWIAATQGLSAELRVVGWLLLAAAWLALAERWQPYRQDWHPDIPALRRDGSVLGLNVLVDGALSAAIGLVAITLAAPQSSLPLGMQVLIGLAAGELVAYGLHRASHEDGWLWRVHLLHHRPSRLNLANALTAHPFNAIYDKLAHVLPMLLLGFSAEAVLIVSLFVLSQGLAVHANIAGTLGPLNRLLGSAELHRLHHSSDPQQAGNFGTALPWWDQLFGTFRGTQSPEQVGVYDPRAYPDEHAVLALLRWPLQRRQPRQMATLAAKDAGCGATPSAAPH